MVLFIIFSIAVNVLKYFCCFVIVNEFYSLEHNVGISFESMFASLVLL